MATAINLHDFRAMAQRRLPKIAFDFIDGGADDETGLVRNRNAFQDYQLIPRYLADITKINQTTSLFGREYASPVGISPTGMAGLFRTGADAMLAAAAKKANVPFLLSSASNFRLEDAAKLAPDNVWFQMYATSDARINHDLVQRAKNAGLGVLAITVDVPVNSNRERNKRNGFTRPFRMTPSIMLDAMTKPGWVLEYLKAGGMPLMSNWQPYAPEGASANEVADLYGTLTPAPMTNWDTVARIREQWSGPLIIKGLLHADDALKAAELGLDGIVVSNHGARQLDDHDVFEHDGRFDTRQRPAAGGGARPGRRSDGDGPRARLLQSRPEADVPVVSVDARQDGRAAEDVWRRHGTARRGLNPARKRPTTTNRGHLGRLPVVAAMVGTAPNATAPR
jgi:L-lactate dehydrogenase (cytochrome)/(S)-mandelate dehydrogenase